MVKSFKSKYTVVFHWHDEMVEVAGKFAYLSDAALFARYAVRTGYMVSANLLNKQGDCIATFSGKQS